MTKRSTKAAKRAASEQTETLADKAIGEIKGLVPTLIIFLLIFHSVAQGYKIPSSSMEDTLLVGDFLIANKVIYGSPLPLLPYRLPAIRKPERGDIVIFRYPGDRVTPYVKRCVGVPGDTLQMIDKQLFVNGEPVPLPDEGKHVARNQDPGRDSFGPLVVPPDSYYMMGDNRDQSLDSRVFGAVPYELIIGQAVVRYFSWAEDINPSPQVQVEDPLSVGRVFLYNAIHAIGKIRWGRFPSLIN